MLRGILLVSVYALSHGDHDLLGPGSPRIHGSPGSRRSPEVSDPLGSPDPRGHGEDMDPIWSSIYSDPHTISTHAVHH